MKKTYLFLIVIIFLFCVTFPEPTNGQSKSLTFEEYIRSATASKEEIDVFLNENTWAQFDPEVGYILGNYAPHDGWDGSRTISTSSENGTRTSSIYINRPCRINTYGNSFTQCHQVSDAETWQEYLAGHLGEPIRNYGMGGFGVYQAYRRMLREESTKNSAECIILYIWGDDHIRSLLRCRYALTVKHRRAQDIKEGVGIMFAGNFWPNIEMNMTTGRLEEYDSRIRIPEKLYQMTDQNWMYENLIDDLALQMYLYKQGRIIDIDTRQLEKLAGYLCAEFNPEAEDLRYEVGKLLDKYAYAATRHILLKSNEFSIENNKKLMIVLFDPGGAMRQLLNRKPRKDQEIVDFIKENDLNYFDMNLVHVDEYKNFNLSVDDYYKRYFIGHYNPAGNHFFAYSIKSRVVDLLDPKPFTYQFGGSQTVDSEGYLEGLK